ncbi:hypothetical protein CEXT_662251 [Caerostris extrusa]|uniref:Uncharacterized protein n=1 Tax=Caerostris extrusa TaxID=172846 RepID=A0AAV4XW16_CAEEX|nr:hypothetical protein CEXT_662251 [Caerostris extrusa]
MTAGWSHHPQLIYLKNENDSAPIEQTGEESKVKMEGKGNSKSLKSRNLSEIGHCLSGFSLYTFNNRYRSFSSSTGP